MQLRHIIHNHCPDCGSTVKRAAVFNLHTNGHWNEEKAFECGRFEVFSPNFMEVRVTGQCERTTKYKEECRKEEVLIEKVRKLVGSADAPEKFKARILDNLKYL